MSKVKGYVTDLTCGWITKEHGDKWLQWQEYASEYLHEQEGALEIKLKTIRKFINYLVSKANYCYDVKEMFRGKNDHIVSSEEFLQSIGDLKEKIRFAQNVVLFVDYIIKKYFCAKDDNGFSIPVVSNPFVKIGNRTKTSETVYSPLPYRYIRDLRHILCPYNKESENKKKPWEAHHFSDWPWAIEHLTPGSLSWMEVDFDEIDHDDPDCVWRSRTVNRKGKKVDIYEIWCPVVAMFLFVKLHLPLRTFQVRFLDSGEADTWRYEKGNWYENDRHEFKLGTVKNPYQRGIFRRIKDTMCGTYTTGLYVSTNKTADLNKDERDKGYVIPWEHQELLYWLEKLRNWQEKYNPISRLVRGNELKRKHFNFIKTTNQLENMGSFAFLFRNPVCKYKIFPIDQYILFPSWYCLLEKLEQIVFNSNHKMPDGSRLSFVKEYANKCQNISKVATEFPLHSLRVSLITCYALETELPFVVISKLLAGHTHLLMTIYYNKIMPSFMSEVMNEAHAVLHKNEENSLKNFLADANLDKIKLRCAFNADKYDSMSAVLTKSKNPVGWEYRPHGLCLAGGNTNKSEGKTVGGCWNGGDLIRDSVSADSRVYAPVSHGPDNCVRCRFFVTDASYLPQLNSHLTILSYKATEASKTANELESELESLQDEKYLTEDKGQIFLKHNELLEVERRYEKQKTEANETLHDYIATFNLIKRIIDIETKRDENDNKQKLVAVGDADDIDTCFKFIETDHELMHLSVMCEDAEFFPHVKDDLRKTAVIDKRNKMLDRMLIKSGFEPVFFLMDEQMSMIAGNAFMRKMSILSNASDKIEGYRIAANYIEMEKYISSPHLLEESIKGLCDVTPVTFKKANKAIEDK
ncbi:MAG: integrase family protein [Nanoarchaeota archaeon]|nr:integrase family protein [Nanoarchaeota archaeon]